MNTTNLKPIIYDFETQEEALSDTREGIPHDAVKAKMHALLEAKKAKRADYSQAFDSVDALFEDLKK